jgi:hypothetical protein
VDKSVLCPEGGPTGGVTSVLHTMEEIPSPLQEINSQKHKAKGWRLLRSVRLASTHSTLGSREARGQEATPASSLWHSLCR